MSPIQNFSLHHCQFLLFHCLLLRCHLPHPLSHHDLHRRVWFLLWVHFSATWGPKSKSIKQRYSSSVSLFKMHKNLSYSQHWWLHMIINNSFLFLTESDESNEGLRFFFCFFFCILRDWCTNLALSSQKLKQSQPGKLAFFRTQVNMCVRAVTRSKHTHVPLHPHIRMYITHTVFYIFT